MLWKELQQIKKYFVVKDECTYHQARWRKGHSKNVTSHCKMQSCLIVCTCICIYFIFSHWLWARGSREYWECCQYVAAMLPTWKMSPKMPDTWMRCVLVKPHVTRQKMSAYAHIIIHWSKSPHQWSPKGERHYNNNGSWVIYLLTQAYSRWQMVWFYIIF